LLSRARRPGGARYPAGGPGARCRLDEFQDVLRRAHGAPDDPDAAQRRGLRQRTHDLDGGGADAILDTQGTRQLESALALATPGARIVLAGGALGALPAAGRLFAGNLSIGGFSISRLSWTAPHRVGAAIREALALLDGGAIVLAVEVHQGLTAAAEVHDLLARGASGKHVVLL
jgi:NADPH2:quinone reductase